MTTAELIEQIKARALELPKDERAAIARELVAAGEALSDAVEDIDPRLDAVITQRLSSIRDGSAHLLSSEEFFDRVRAKIATR